MIELFSTFRAMLTTKDGPELDFTTARLSGKTSVTVAEINRSAMERHGVDYRNFFASFF